MRILIAEDDPVARLIMRKSIVKLGHECLVASDGEEAWNILQTEFVDAVLSDWIMPGMDGLELCRKLRQVEDRPYTYFLILTAHGEKENFIRGMQAGADDYLVKPVDIDSLEARLVAAERVTKLHRQLREKMLELEDLNQQLFEEGRRDALTRLRNRLCMQEDLAALYDQAKRYGHSFCAALCDIDFYKKYNDHYGHQAGDEVLRQVSAAMANTVRKSDKVYRYGGEEFLIILPEQTLESAGEASERIRRVVSELGIRHQLSPKERVTISTGVALMPSGAAKSIDEVLKEADEALYSAKSQGRDCICVNRDGEVELFVSSITLGAGG